VFMDATAGNNDEDCGREGFTGGGSSRGKQPQRQQQKRRSVAAAGAAAAVPDKIFKLRNGVFYANKKDLLALWRPGWIKSYRKYDLHRLAREYMSVSRCPSDDWLAQYRLRMVGAYMIRAMRRDIACASPTEVAAMYNVMCELRKEGAGGGCSGGMQ